MTDILFQGLCRDRFQKSSAKKFQGFWLLPLKASDCSGQSVKLTVVRPRNPPANWKHVSPFQKNLTRSNSPKRAFVLVQGEFTIPQHNMDTRISPFCRSNIHRYRFHGTCLCLRDGGGVDPYHHPNQNVRYSRPILIYLPLPLKHQKS